MAENYQVKDLQKCNKALGEKWQILKTAMEEIQAGKGLPELVAKKELEKQAEIKMETLD